MFYYTYASETADAKTIIIAHRLKIHLHSIEMPILFFIIPYIQMRTIFIHQYKWNNFNRIDSRESLMKSINVILFQTNMSDTHHLNELTISFSMAKHVE